MKRHIRRGVIAVPVPVSTFPVAYTGKSVATLSRYAKTDIASDPSPVNEVGNLTSGIQVTCFAYTVKLITGIPWVLI